MPFEFLHSRKTHSDPGGGAQARGGTNQGIIGVQPVGSDTNVLWNPADAASFLVVSADRTNVNFPTATHAPGQIDGAVRANRFRTTGKYYSEFSTQLSASATNDNWCGLTNSSLVLETADWENTGNPHTYVFTSTYSRSPLGLGISTGHAFTVGGFMMLAVDLDIGRVWFGQDGFWYLGGDPASGANPFYQGITPDSYALCGTSGFKDAFTYIHTEFSQFRSEPPTGFIPWTRN